MHAYIHIHSIHAHIYMHIYTCTYCMDATTPPAVLSSIIHQTHTLHYIFSHAFYITTHTHTLLTLIQACYTKPLSFLGITGHPPR